MNASREQSQKLIGFKLFGNLAQSLETSALIIDPNKTFEIQILPEQIPHGTVTYLGRHDEKKIIVELPEEIKQSSFEKICTFLLERNAQLFVREHGYEKLGNRKLHLEINYELKEPFVNLILFIQGKCNAIEYEIEINPNDLSCSIGEIRNSKNYIKANVIMEDLIKIKKCDTIKVLAKLKPNNFLISIDGDCIKIDLCPPLKQFIDSLGKPSKYQKQSIEKGSIDTYPEEVVQSNEDQTPSKGSMWPIFRKMYGKR